MPLLAPVTAITVSDVISGMTGTTTISAALFRDHSRVRNSMSSWNWASMSGVKVGRMSAIADR